MNIATTLSTTSKAIFLLFLGLLSYSGVHADSVLSDSLQLNFQQRRVTPATRRPCSAAGTSMATVPAMIVQPSTCPTTWQQSAPVRSTTINGCASIPVIRWYN